MKKLLLSLALLSMWACSRNYEPAPQDEGTGTIAVRIVGDDARGRYLVTGSESIVENEVKSYCIAVFDYRTGAFEAFAVGDLGGTTLLTGISTANTKRIVVSANTPEVTEVVLRTGYDKFKVKPIMGQLLTAGMYAEYYGMSMYGETGEPAVIKGGVTNNVDIHLKRLAAKVTLGTLTITDAAQAPTLAGMTLERVSMQRVPNNTTPTLTGDCEIPSPSSLTYTGGVQGSISFWGGSQTTNSFLFDEITTPSLELNTTYTFNNYFYAARNENEACPTLLSLQFAAPGGTVYYPVVINSENMGTAAPGDTDGTLLQSNHQYRVNLNITNLGNYSPDPDIPVAPGVVEVEIDIEPWYLTIEQDVELL